MTISNIKRRWLRRVMLVLYAPILFVAAPIIYGFAEAFVVLKEAIEQVIQVWRKP